MRSWLWVLAALFACALAVPPAAAQTPLDCATAGQSVCADGEILAIEDERAALVGQLTELDPQNPALALEQTWLDGLGACGEDADCYRTAYLNHNQMLRQTLAALPGAAEEPPLEAPIEAPPDAAPFEPLPAPQEERAPPRRREPAREPSGDAYVAAGLPGWGFFAAFGVTLLILYALLRARRRNREELRGLEDAPSEDGWRF